MSTKYGWEHAKQNCLSFKRQYHEQDTKRRTFAKLDQDSVFMLIERAPSSAHAMRIRLRADMNNKHWSLVATLHRGGKENATTPPDEELHFTLRFDHGGYHIRCREGADSKVYVFDITFR